MAIPRMEEDVEIITKLGDVPGSDDGLSTQELKSKFDLAAVRIKNFINNILIPGIENSVDEGALLTQIGNALSRKLSLSGGIMTGDINMNGKSISNVKTPTQDSDVTTKEFVEEFTSTNRIPKTLSSSGWSSAAPYIQSIVVPSLTDERQAMAYPDVPEDASQEAEFMEEAGKITSCRRSGSTMTFRCREEKPEIDIPVIVEVYV